MASEWRIVQIEEVAEKVSMGPFGSSIKVETFVPSGVPIISGQHLHGSKVNDSVEFNFISTEHAERLSNANVRRGDVIFTHAGNIGQVALIPESSQYERYVISQRQFYMRCNKKKVLPEFIVAYFKTPEGQHQLLANTSQVGVPSIAQPVTYLRTIEFPLPSIPEQQAIAHILGTLDDKIELNRRMNETLEAMARALFKSWFVDFDPVRAKAEGRDPGLPKQIADLFPDSFEDSELGEIPKGWSKTSWGTLVSLEYGKSLGDYAGDQGAYPVYGTNGMIGSHSEPLCNHPGIIIGRKGAYRGIHFCNTPFFVIDTAFYVKPKMPIELRWAYYELLRIDLNNMDSGSAIPSTSREDFYSLPVVSPPFEVQQAFVQLLNPFLTRHEQNNKESDILSNLRDVLLSKLISGELRVRDAYDFLERC